MRFSTGVKRSYFAVLALAAAFILGSVGAAPALPAAAQAGEDLPPGARIEVVLSGMTDPVAMAFDPDGRLFYTEKSTGNVRLFANGQLQERPVINYVVSTCSERGLLGIAIDPNFRENRFIYVYYTQGPGCGATENKVARFVERDGIGSGSTDIFRSPQTAGNHDGGNIHFGPDGKLYVSVGDNANAANSQNLGVPNGKIHRINPDGSIPNDNPEIYRQPGALGSIYAHGLRNSFDFTFDSVVPGRIFASENGPGCDDEMNRIEAGFNYGWRANYPCNTGTPDPRFNTIPPLWYVDGGGCCPAPTGIEVYTGHQVPQWRNHLFMAVYRGTLYHFTLTDDRNWVAATNIVRGVTANMDIETGPDGALYYMEGGGYSDGTLKRIVGPGQPPAQATATTAPAPAPGTPGPGPSIPGNGSTTFPETGRTVTGIFLQYWQQNGGLPQQGYPISGLVNEVSDLNGRPYVMQYFERAVFEYHPENQPPYNVLLSQLGTLRYRQKYPNGAPNQQANNSPGSVLFPQTGKRVGGRFLQYWQQNGGVAQQGYPISEEFQERSDLNGQTYTVQYFERAVFEHHPENRAPFDVLLSQLGKFRFDEKYGGR